MDFEVEILIDYRENLPEILEELGFMSLDNKKLYYAHKHYAILIATENHEQIIKEQIDKDKYREIKKKKTIVKISTELDNNYYRRIMSILFILLKTLKKYEILSFYT